MMNLIRRTILATGAAATAVAAAQKGAVRIHFEGAGSGFPLLLIAGGGLNSTISGLSRTASRGWHNSSQISEKQKIASLGRRRKRSGDRLRRRGAITRRPRPARSRRANRSNGSPP